MAMSFFKRYCVVMTALIAMYLCIPQAWAIHILWQVSIGWLAAGSIVASIRYHNLTPAIAWWFCAAGIAFNATGIVAQYLIRNTACYLESTFPCLPDFFWLMLFPNLVVGLSILAHRRAYGRDWSVIVDTAIVVTGLSLLSWVFLISASPQNNQLTLSGLVAVIAYPVGDLAILGILLRLLLQGNRNTSLLLIAGSLGLFLFGDMCWVVLFRFEHVPEGFRLTLLETIFLLAFMAMGAAATHPTAKDIIKPIPERSFQVSLMLLVILCFTSLLPSAVLLYQSAKGSVTDGVAIGVSSAILFLLVITRVVGLLRKVESQALQLSALSRIDELTGLYNRRAWAEELNVALERVRRDQTPICIALIDLDKFKVFNDTFGHQAGDTLLKSAARAWADIVRLPDIIGRYGGEEFILILPNTDLKGASILLERLRPVTPANQTFSAGLGLWNKTDSVDTFLQKIDQALYRAKSEGRNRTVIGE